jgi:hypothetical protein
MRLSTACANMSLGPRTSSWYGHLTATNFLAEDQLPLKLLVLVSSLQMHSEWISNNRSKHRQERVPVLPQQYQ